MRLEVMESRSIRRALVIAATLLWAALVSPFPQSLDGAGMVWTLALLGVDIALGVVTGWLAFARGGAVDEREATLRDRAYHLAFRLVALGVIVIMIAAIVGSITANPSGLQLEPVLGGRWVVAMLQLLIALPTLVIAWLAPDWVAGDDADGRPAAANTRWLAFLALPLLAVLWFTLIATLPVRASAVQNNGMHGMMGGASCGRFVASREVGFGFGAQLRIDVQTCWDRSRAFPFLGEQPEFLSRCVPVSGTADFARIRNLTCSERTDADGSLYYAMHATVESGLGATVSRDMTLELAVTRNGVASTVG